MFSEAKDDMLRLQAIWMAAIGSCVGLMWIFHYLGYSNMASMAAGLCLMIIAMGLLQNHRWLVILVGFLARNYRAVELVDHHGERYFTLAREDHTGDLVAHVYWLSQIGYVRLKDDGRNRPNTPSAYIFFWLPCRRADRMVHALRTNLPDFDELERLDSKEKHATLREYYERPE